MANPPNEPKRTEPRVFDDSARARLPSQQRFFRFALWIAVVVLDAAGHLWQGVSLLSFGGDALTILSAVLIERRVRDGYAGIRMDVQSLLSNRFGKDFRSAPMVGIAPGLGKRDYGGVDSWDIGFLEFGSRSFQFFGEQCSFSLTSREVTSAWVEASLNSVCVSWRKQDGLEHSFQINIKHAAKESVRLARSRIIAQIRAIASGVQADLAPEGFYPPVLEWNGIRVEPRGVLVPPVLDFKGANGPRDPISASGKRLSELIWRCACGEVNIMSHARCRICNQPIPLSPQLYVA